MTDAPPARSWWRWSRRSVAAFLVALAIGAGVGMLVNVLSPNPVYGFQLIADFLAIVALLVVVLVPVLRGLRPAALGLAIGVIAGVAIGMALNEKPSREIAGTVDLKLGLPEVVDASAAASCIVESGALLSLVTPEEGALRLADGRWIGLRIEPSDLQPAVPGRALDIVVLIRSALAGGSPTFTEMTSDASSTISITNAGATGSMAFSDLVLGDGEQREPIDLAGTVSWDCVP